MKGSMSMINRRSWRLGVVLWSACATLLLGGVWVANSIIDPYDLTSWLVRDGFNKTVPTLNFQSRMAKAVGIIRDRPDTVMLGSSITNVGFAIEGSTANGVRRGADENQAFPGIFNAGINSGGMHDILVYLRHAWINNPHLKRAIIGIEWHMVWVPSSGYEDSPALYHAQIPPLIYCKYLTWTALDDAVRTVEANRGISNPQGLGNLLHLRSWLIPDAAAAQPLPEPVGIFSRLPVRARSPVETRAIYYSVAHVSRLIRLREMEGPQALIGREFMADLQAAVSFAHEKGIELVVYVSPQHPVLSGEILGAGLWEDYANWLRSVAKITPFYDLSSIAFARDPDADYSGDAVHYRSVLGEKLLPLLVGLHREDATSMERVTVGNVEEDIVRQQGRLSQWLENNPYIKGVLAQLNFKTYQPTTMTEILPTQWTPAPPGFRVIQLLGKYYGLPEFEEPFDLDKVLNHEYAPMVAANSAAGAIAEIDRRGLKSWGYAAADLKDGAALASGDDSGSPERAFDSDRATYWVSAERGTALKGNAWLGYAFPEPLVARRLMLVQPTNMLYREDSILVQSSRDGGVTWQDVVAKPIRLFDEEEASVINLPESAPASWWRIVAADASVDTPLGAKNAWAVEELAFFVRAGDSKPSPFTAVDLAGGAPIASGNGAVNADRAFDKKVDTFWVSGERGAAVKDNAWIGYRFNSPQAVRRIEIVQPENQPYRQDVIRVDSSADGQHWEPALPGPVRVRGRPSVIDLAPAEPVRFWRVVAAGDNAKTPEQAWSVEELRFFGRIAEPKVAASTQENGLLPHGDHHPPPSAPLQLVASSDPPPLSAAGSGSKSELVALPPSAGTARASQGDTGSPDRAFDGHLETFWLSTERGGAVRDHAWIGYEFSDPRAIGRIHIAQSNNQPFRQDLVRVERSLDGGETWEQAVPNPVRLSGAASDIDVPAGKPARLWRLVAAGDNAKSDNDAAWTVEELSFFVPADEAKPATPTAISDAAGTPISSGGDAGSPDRAFDGSSDSFWVSAERGDAIKDNAWIGWHFSTPQAVEHIRIEQPANPLYHQELVRVEKSLDDGKTWVAAAPGPFQLHGKESWIDLPAGDAASFWRLVAASDNAGAKRDAWAVIELNFYPATSAPKAN
jgi:hypothetical protein